jgi:hypothetical protein
LRRAARRDVQTILRHVDSAAFATFSRQRVGAALVGDSTFFSRHIEQLAALAARYAMPAIYPFPEFALANPFKLRQRS